ncbi:MAG TPA: 23S rRNA (adenine(2030)-N(6))-methyltransferase RlmJ [Methylovirgula sp.]|nr:23S rRNA (adenine(2030)-N(6))-methyltransferase RlmJ [Methylovirgula sp.]
MNYRHAFHAGNFADVFKHVILTRILLYLTRKETALRIVETHAGDGIYDLSATPAEKTSEWRAGIGRLVATSPPPDIAALLEPYLAIVKPLIAGKPPLYPGSPMLASRLLRRQDRMIFCDAHPQSIAALRAEPDLGRDRRVKIIGIDGYLALNAFVPPVERRGLVLIDPPFEERTEFADLLAGLTAAARKWPTGVYMIWYPIKDEKPVADFLEALAAALPQAGVRRILRLELKVDQRRPDGPLAANGLVILNPPHILDMEARKILSYLAQVMGSTSYSRADIAWLARD